MTADSGQCDCGTAMGWVDAGGSCVFGGCGDVRMVRWQGSQGGGWAWISLSPY